MSKENCFDVEADFDDDMLNDAIAILRFPVHRVSTVRWLPRSDHEEMWVNRWFAKAWNGEVTPKTIEVMPSQDEINQLSRRILVFADDYLTKATAACPVGESWCLPHPGRYLTFRDRAVCVRLDSTQCDQAERRRLLGAFLRYEVIRKFRPSHNGIEDLLHYRESSGELLTSRLRPWEKQAIACVEEYLKYLYRAVVIQCGNSELPQVPPARHISEVFDSTEWGNLISEPPPEEYYDRRSISFLDLSLNSSELCRSLACFGLKLASIVVEGVTTGQYGRSTITKWLKTCANDRTFRSGRVPDLGLIMFPFHDYRDDPNLYRDCSGLYRRLFPRIGNMQWYYQRKFLELYRSRAWVFLDDARLFKLKREGPHFPAEDIVFSDVEFDDIIGHRQSMMHDLRARCLRRLDWTSMQECRLLSRWLWLGEEPSDRDS
ncbi:hypothetical protein GGR57DRAFT_92359 [Xylariaceae sp. FL1272]|nr:hypothetical protein GGR57DRAFT_92359 [Xylariaceae sp. FL1272]